MVGVALLNGDVNHSAVLGKRKGVGCSVCLVSTANTDRYLETLLFYQGYQGRHKLGYRVSAVSPKRLMVVLDLFS